MYPQSSYVRTSYLPQPLKPLRDFVTKAFKSLVRIAPSFTTSKQRTKMLPFVCGDKITRLEVTTSYKKIFGPFARSDISVHDQLSIMQRLCRLQFEFEVNRLRGYAYEL
jgi:hypothetical protein